MISEDANKLCPSVLGCNANHDVKASAGVGVDVVSGVECAAWSGSKAENQYGPLLGLDGSSALVLKNVNLVVAL
jgi:hypothetical protein